MEACIVFTKIVKSFLRLLTPFIFPVTSSVGVTHPHLLVPEIFL